MSSATAVARRFVPERKVSAGRALRVVALIVLDAVVALSVPKLFGDGTAFFASGILLVVAGINVVLLFDRLAPWRWLAPGIALLVLLTVVPVAYTCYVAFTNYSDSHLLSRTQAVRALEVDTYLPKGAPVSPWKAYRAADGSTALYLAPAAGAEGRLVTSTGQSRTLTPGADGVGALQDGAPASIPGYTRLTLAQTVVSLKALQDARYGPPGEVVRITSLSAAANYQQRYTYDDATETVTDRQSGKTFTPRRGTFTAADGTTISPAFRASIGWGNFAQLFGDKVIRSVALQIFLWNIVFAVLGVALQFVAGLIISVALNDRAVPRRLAKVIRSILLLPYVIPSFLTVLVWGAMLNPNIGLVTTAMARLFGVDANWVANPTGSKLAVLLVVFWLGFPYFVLVVSGGLQAIPGELLEAADVDGAGPVQRFRSVTMPILMRMIGPLIVLHMAGNFNNFLVIFLLTKGSPPFEGTPVPAGHSDILLSFTYKLSFTFGNGANYGLAAVITMLIFLILLPIVASQFRYYAVWQED